MRIEDWGDFPKEFAGRARQVAKKFVQFDTLIAPAVIQVLFWVWVVFAVISGIALIPFAPVSGLGMIVLGPLVARIAAEFLLVIFHLLVNLNERLEPAGAERPGNPKRTSRHRRRSMRKAPKPTLNPQATKSPGRSPHPRDPFPLCP